MTSKQLSKYCLVVMALLLSTPAMSQFGDGGVASTNAVQALQATAYQADQAYAEQNFRRAFKLYERLAKDAGDEFAQYRLALMYYFGQHVEQDLVKSYAWSYLAAETGIDQFQQFHRQVKSQIDPNLLTGTQAYTKDLQKKFGVFQQAYETRQLLRKEKFSCTGSRVGNTCASVSTQDFSCAASADRSPSERCLRMGRMGINSVTGTFPLKLRQVEAELQDIMRTYNPGQVTLGEFEVLVEDGDAVEEGDNEQ